MEYYGQKTIGELLERVLILEEKVKKLESKKKKTKSKGAEVWESYNDAYQKRYNCRAARNPKINTQCSNLVTYVGLEEAIELANFYVQQNDYEYTKNNHPFGILLLKYETLRTRLKTGHNLTHNQARRNELIGTNANASKEYLERKYK